jgi:hypothetical protein
LFTFKVADISNYHSLASKVMVFDICTDEKSCTFNALGIKLPAPPQTATRETGFPARDYDE